MHLDLQTCHGRSIGPWQSMTGKHHSDGSYQRPVRAISFATFRTMCWYFV